MVTTSYVPVADATIPADLLTPAELDDPAACLKIGQEWVAAFDKAITTADAVAFDNLFCEEGFWRDLVAFTNDYRGIAKPNIFQAASDTLAAAKASGATVSLSPAPFGARPFAGHSFINVRFTFTTGVGPAIGMARIVKTSSGEYKAFVGFTCIDGVHGVPEKAAPNREEGGHNSKLTYAQLRQQEIDNPEPSVLIVGAGHNGLDTAARLKAYGVKSLIVDKNERVGDNWRSRYASLTLHDTLWGANLPYLKFPTCYPRYLSAGMLADWLELYSAALGLNVWMKSRVDPEQTSYDPATSLWTVTVLRNGVTPYQFKVTHIVMATGLGGGKPKIPPPFPGQEKFKKPVKHSFFHKSGADYEGKEVLVVGSGSSGHDVAFDFYNNGAHCTILQRSPTYVMSLKNGIEFYNKGAYQDDGPPIEQSDEMVETLPHPVSKAYFQRFVPMIAEKDKEMIEGLNAAGFKTWLGPQGSGHPYLSMIKNGGYYFDSGCCEHIINGDIKVKGQEIDYFTEDKVYFKDGSSMAPEVVILATGVTGFRESVAETLGEKATKSLKEVWGIDDEAELNSCFRDCGIPRVYFMMGALPLARFNSKVCMLQIVAEQAGKLGERYSIEKQKAAA
ncbi:hypothetical protein BZA70DRAFT_271905 [Myxozyma melibiosi]|uniref:Flavin-containing monooxygenase n=1 Tax=Myxozyma melibiosi TaxID=54550 RepID=A0ABR1FD53_9ASCO